jgi:hypothetical protein
LRSKYVADGSFPFSYRFLAEKGGIEMLKTFCYILRKGSSISMMTTKLFVIGLLVIGLGGIGVTAYAIAPSLNLAAAQGQADSQASTPRNESPAAQPSTSDPAQMNVPALEDTQAITATNTLTGSLKIATAIADHFNVAVADITQLHDSGWGYGEIYMLYAYAQASGKSVADIEAMRAAGQGWGEIAKTLNLPPGNHGNNLGSVVSQSHGIPSTGPGNGKSNPPPGKGGNQGKGKGQDQGKGKGK